MKRINWSIHSTKTCAKETKVQWNVSFRRSNFASPTQIFTSNAHTDPLEVFFTKILHSENEKHIQCLLQHKWEMGTTWYNPQIRWLIQWVIDKITKFAEILQYYNIACSTTNDTLVRMQSKYHQKSSNIIRVIFRAEQLKTTLHFWKIHTDQVITLWLVLGWN